MNSAKHLRQLHLNEAPFPVIFKIQFRVVCNAIVCLYPSLPADKDFCPCCFHTEGKKRKLLIWSFHHCPQILTFTPKRKGKLFFWSFHHCPQIRTSVLAATISTGKKREAPHLELPSLPADLSLLLPYTRKRKRKLFFWSFHHCPQIRTSVLAATIHKEKKRKLFFWGLHHCPQIRTSVLAATRYTGKNRKLLNEELPSLPADKDFCPCCYHINRKEKGSSSFGAPH